MIDIELTEHTLVVHLKGLDVALALKGRLEVPLKHIVDVIVNPEEVSATFKHLWAGVRVGTHIPGVLLAGTFSQHDEKNFWDVHHPEHIIVISLADEQYNKLILEVADPQGVADTIKAKIHTS